MVFGEEFLEVFLMGVGVGGFCAGFPGASSGDVYKSWPGGFLARGFGVLAWAASFFAVGVAGEVGVYVWFYEGEYASCEGFQRVGLSSVQRILHYGCQDFEPDVPRQVAYCFVEAAVEYE